MKKMFFIFAIISLSCSGSIHSDVFQVPLRNNKATNTPSSFVKSAGYLFRDFKKATGHYPNSWEELKECEKVKYAYIYQIVFNVEKSDIRINNNELIAYNNSSKKEYYKYIIFGNKDFEFLLKSENNAGIQNYITDSWETWYYFSDENSEMAAINNYKKIINTKSFIFNNKKKRKGYC